MFTPLTARRRPVIVPSLLAWWLAAAALPAPAQQPAAPASAASAPAGPTMRNEVIKPLLAAQESLKGSDEAAGKAALVSVTEAEAVPALTPFETYNIQRIKAVAAFKAGDRALALNTFETVLGSPHMPQADKLPITEVAVKLALEANNDPARSLRLLKAYRELGGNDPALRRRYAALLVERNEHAAALQEARSAVEADEAAGRAPSELMLKVMAISYNKLNDQPAYNGVLEKLTRYYTSLDYWSELISRTARRPGFAEERLRLDLYRLQRAVGLALETDEQADMALRAMQAGLPAEAQKLMDEGYAAGLFGKGAQAAAHQRLRDQATKAAAADQKGLNENEAAARNGKDGNVAANLAMAIAATGANERALGLLEAAIAKGGLRQPNEALLHQGMLQARLGRNDDALKTFAAVQGSDGTADLARLWSIHLRSTARKS